MPEQNNDHPPQTVRTDPTWSKLHLWQMQPIRDVLLGLGIFLLIIAGQKTSVVTVPVLLAILLAYLFEPVICWLMQRFGVSRRTSVISIMAAVVMVVVIPLSLGGAYAIGQLVGFTSATINNSKLVNEAVDGYGVDEGRVFLEDSDVPTAWVWVYDQVRDSESSFGAALDSAIDWVNNNSDQVARTTADIGIDFVNMVIGFLGAIFGLSFMLFVTAFFFFFTATEWVQLKGFGTNLLPDKNRDRIIDLLEKCDAVISGFIRGRVTIAFIQSIVFSVGYFLIGVPGAFILGPVVAILSIVPYLALVGLPVSVSLLALHSFPDGSFRGAWWWVVGAPVGFYFLGQALDDYIWTPMIQGKSTGMDTPTILFASLAGGALFGVFGLLIAIPIAACIKILIQEIFWPRFKEWAEGRADDPLPIE